MIISAFQMCVSKDIAENTAKILGAIRQASGQGAEILLTPEGSLSGYTPDHDRQQAKEALDEVLETARQHNIGLALGTCFYEDDGNCYNQLRFYRPDGQYLGFHSKTLLCGSISGEAIGEYNHYATSDLRVFDWKDGLCVGGLICNDMWANPTCTRMADPHLTQRLADMGAQIIFHGVNGGRNDSDWSRLVWQYHESNLRMRAAASKAWIVTIDNAFPVSIRTAAPGGVIDPTGNFVHRSPEKGEHVFVFDIPTHS